VVVGSVVIALIIGGLAGWKLYLDNQQEQETAGTPLDETGPDAATADCQDVVTEPADLELQQDGTFHLPLGTRGDYADSPPGFGLHWPEWAEFGRKFYTAEDRPEVERLVHNEEHGYTILWYDQTVAADADQLQTVEDIAATFDGDAAAGSPEYEEAKLIAAPWTDEDGEPFPGGAHVALTRWAAEGDDAIEDKGMGVWQYCGQPSGEAVQDFMDDYPASNSLEPGAA
jgi:hypothetical protein